MNYFALVLLLLLTALANAALADPITDSSSWTKSYTVSTATPTLNVRNIWGSVRIRPGKAGEILVSASESRSAADRESFDASLEVIRLNTAASDTGLSLSVGDPENRWDWRGPCRECRVHYEFDITVPPGTQLDVSTVMDGVVDIDGIEGLVSASNVNGRILIQGISNCSAIESVNGSVAIQFSAMPRSNCDIETVNGDVTLGIPAGSSLDVAMNLFNGEVRSDFKVSPFAQAATVERSVADGRSLFRIEQLTGLRIGAGGPTYTIASINGDVQIKEN